jgi:hypothetical protein
MEVLVEAKKEYTDQLCEYILPVVIQTLAKIYQDAEEMDPRDTIKQFQTLLQEVKHWNQTLVKQHTDMAMKSCPCFTELLAAVMVANVKILSSVRLVSEQKKISIRMPSNEIFVHSCYINCARNVYYDPAIFKSTASDQEKEYLLKSRLKPCIEITIKELVPIQQILSTYIGSQAEPTMDIGNGEDTPDPDISDEPEETEQGPEPEPEPEPQTNEESFFDEEKTSDESKWISSGNRHMQQQPQQSLQSSTSGGGQGLTETATMPQTPVLSNPPSSMQ